VLQSLGLGLHRRDNNVLLLQLLRAGAIEQSPLQRVSRWNGDVDAEEGLVGGES
jgi:hypothetical protein